MARAGLTADQIALVTNRNEPQSAELARYYAQARGVPEGRIIELDIPPWDELAFDRFEADVIPVIRDFLTQRGLAEQVRCLVTVFGIPLRIPAAASSPAEAQELALLRAEHRVLLKRIREVARDTEALAGSIEPGFAAGSSDDATVEALARRVERAGRVLESATARLTDADRRQQVLDAVAQLTQRLTGPIELPSTIPSASAPAGPSPDARATPRRYDPSTRARDREQQRRNGGLFAYARLIESQIESLTTESNGAAFDSELALLWWPAYPRTRWLPNPLNPRFQATGAPRTLMVMRLDAPTPQLVRDLIANSVLTERDGLRGRLVVDSRGIAEFDAAGKPDPFGVFDERLRKLARLAKAGGLIPVKLDSAPAVIPPDSETDVALYCGWYSVRSYVPGMRFNRGAVGYHVASFELMSLRGENEPGWCRGLLNSGVVATVGPVAEPYLHSFPAPDEFFPLLMTGRLTLAEVYWTTTPLVSWMQACIGDPLYTPYERSPAIKMDLLPSVLRRVVESNGSAASTQALDQPGR